TSPPATQPNKIPSAVNVKSSDNPSTFAEPLKFSVAVVGSTGNAPAPTGHVVASLSGSYVLATADLDSNGLAILNIPQDPGPLAVVPWGLGASANAILISYAGDLND